MGTRAQVRADDPFLRGAGRGSLFILPYGFSPSCDHGHGGGRESHELGTGTGQHQHRLLHGLLVQKVRSNIVHAHMPLHAYSGSRGSSRLRDQRALFGCCDINIQSVTGKGGWWGGRKETK